MWLFRSRIIGVFGRVPCINEQVDNLTIYLPCRISNVVSFSLSLCDILSNLNWGTIHILCGPQLHWARRKWRHDTIFIYICTPLYYSIFHVSALSELPRDAPPLLRIYEMQIIDASIYSRLVTMRPILHSICVLQHSDQALEESMPRHVAGSSPRSFD